MAVNKCLRISPKQLLNKKSIFRLEFGYFARRTALMSLFILCLQLNAGHSTATEISCTAVKSLFETKGMPVDIEEQPNSDAGGLCPTKGCCGASARTKMISLARQQLESSLRSELNKQSAVLAARAHRFDEFFKGLLLHSKHEFHEMFKRTYGLIYEQHSYVFTDLFAQLERYYEHGDVDLVQLMDKFFVVLYQKMFTVLNSQYTFDDKYLQCVSDHMRDIQPFEDVPHKLSIQLRRAFVATRTFQKALQAGAEVAKNMIEIGVSEECTAAWARLRGCGACAGAAQPACARYCLNTVRGCLPLHADLSHQWDAYVDAVDNVSDRLLGPFNIAMVVEPIDIKISEAIMNFQEHSQEISQRIFSGCGKPVLGGAVPASVANGPFFGPAKREKRNLRPRDSVERFDSKENSASMDDFEIEASYESLVNKNPFLLGNKRSESSEDYDIDAMHELIEKAQQRERFLKYMRGQINSVELGDYEQRSKRDADPEPKAGKESKEIDFEPYNFEGGSKSGRRKANKKPGKKMDSQEWSEGSGGGGGGAGGGGGGAALERLVRESRARVRNSRKFWAHLPYVLCSDTRVAAAPASHAADARCYNGTHVASYLPALAGEGVTALATNPEVRGQPSRTSVLQTQQDTLRAITTKLKNAYNGHDVDWRDYADDSANLFYGSGSGSGDHPDDDDITDDDEDHRSYNEDDLPGSGHGPVTEEDDTEESAPVEAEAGAGAVGAEDGRLDTAAPAPAPQPPAAYPPAEPPAVVERPAAGAAPPAPAPMSLQRALLSYLFPVVCAWFGTILTDIV